METFSRLSPNFVADVRPYDPEADRTFGEELGRIGAGLVSLPADIMAPDTGWHRAAAAAEEASYATDVMTSSRVVREDWFTAAADRIKRVSGVNVAPPSLSVTMDPTDTDYAHAFARGTATSADLEGEFFAKASELAGRYPELADITADRLQTDIVGRARSAAAGSDAIWQDRSMNPWIKGSATFWGGTVGAVRAVDPATIGSMLLPSGGRGAGLLERLASTFLTQGAVGAVTAAAEQPAVQAWREEAGLPHGWAEAATNVAMGAAMGAAGGIVIHGAGEAIGAAGRAVKALVSRGVDVTPEMEAALRSAAASDLETAAMRAARPPEVPEHATDAVLADGLAAAAEPSAPLPLVDIAIPPGTTDTLARRLLAGASDLAEALDRLNANPADQADFVLRTERPMDMAEIASLRQQVNINAARIADVEARLASPELSEVRRAFGAAESVATNADRLQRAADKSASSVEKARLAARSQAEAAKAKAIVDGLDPQLVDELDRLEAEIGPRRSGQDQARSALANAEAAVQADRVELSRQFARGGDFRGIARARQNLSEAATLKNLADEMVKSAAFADDRKAATREISQADELYLRAKTLEKGSSFSGIISALASPDPKIRDLGRIATLDPVLQARVTSGDLAPMHAAVIASTTRDPALQAVAAAAIDEAHPNTVAAARTAATAAVAAENAHAAEAAMMGAPRFENPPKVKGEARATSSDIKDAVPMVRSDGTVEMMSRANLERVAEREHWMSDVIAACKV